MVTQIKSKMRSEKPRQQMVKQIEKKHPFEKPRQRILQDITPQNRTVTDMLSRIDVSGFF